MDEYTKPYNQRPADVPGQRAGAPAPTGDTTLPACPHHRPDVTAPGAVPSRPGVNPSAVVGAPVPPASRGSEQEVGMPGEFRSGE